jgi:hypothetical protein
MTDIIQSLWVGPELSVLERLCIESFLKNGHPFHLYCYDTVKNVPDGAVIKDANEILPEAEVFLQPGTKPGQGSLAVFSDWWRYKMLYERGNYWVDMDVICLRPFDFPDPVVIGEQTSDSVAIGVMKFPKGHQIMADACEASQNPQRIFPWDRPRDKRRKIMRRFLPPYGRAASIFGTTGPKLITGLLEQHGLRDAAKPFSYFYPIHCDNWITIFDETLAKDSELFADTYALHFWNEMTRRHAGFDKNAEFPEQSLIEQLKRRYLS